MFKPSPTSTTLRPSHSHRTTTSSPGTIRPRHSGYHRGPLSHRLPPTKPNLRSREPVTWSRRRRGRRLPGGRVPSEATSRRKLPVAAPHSRRWGARAPASGGGGLDSARAVLAPPSGGARKCTGAPAAAAATAAAPALEGLAGLCAIGLRASSGLQRGTRRIGEQSRSAVKARLRRIGWIRFPGGG